MEKYSNSLGRNAVYTKTSKINKLVSSNGLKNDKNKTPYGVSNMNCEA